MTTPQAPMSEEYEKRIRDNHLCGMFGCNVCNVFKRLDQTRAKIKELQDENEKFRAELEISKTTIKDLAQTERIWNRERDELKAENEALKSDAAAIWNSRERYKIMMDSIKKNQQLRERVGKLREAFIAEDTLSDGSRSCGCHYGFKTHSIACSALAHDDQLEKEGEG